MYKFTEKCIEQAVDSLIRSEYYVSGCKRLQANNITKDENKCVAGSVNSCILCRTIDRNISNDYIIEKILV